MHLSVSPRNAKRDRPATWSPRSRAARHLTAGFLAVAGLVAGCGSGSGAGPSAGAAVSTSRPTSPAHHAPARAARPTHLAAPATIPQLIPGAPAPGEGAWTTAVSVHGAPAVRVTYVRADAALPSASASLMWLDPTLLAARFHPGSVDPGGPLAAQDIISPAEQPAVVAAYNGGFKMNGDSRGGVYTGGQIVRPMRDGAASLIVYKNGKVTIGSWGQEVHPSPTIASVRQNLDMLVDGGQVNPTCSQGSGPTWGYTLGGVTSTWRSGVGVTKDGAVIYVVGPYLSPCALGDVLRAAGAVRGMQLDINPAWTTGYYFTHPSRSVTVPHALASGQTHTADRYFSPQTRDFFAWYARTL